MPYDGGMPQLHHLLKEANYDEGLDLIGGWDLTAVMRAASSPLERLRLTCMVSDVCDYGGRYIEAENVIKKPGDNGLLQRRLHRRLCLLCTYRDD
jgi:hypothetical protein